MSLRPALGSRVESIDVYRGIVMLMLVPNPFSAFGVKAMSDQNPDDPFWALMAGLFTHVPWSGVSFWDLIMPSFVFLIGASMPLSYAARAAIGERHSTIIHHAILRAIALALLGLMLSVKPTTYLDEIWPFIMLFGLGLPVPTLVARRLGLEDLRSRPWIETVWWYGLLAAALVQVLFSIRNPGNHEFGNLLVQVGFAFVPAFLLVNRSLAVQGSVAMAILIVYWLVFVFYPVPPADFDLSKVAVSPGDEIFSGLFAHWNKNTNAAAAFDVWLFSQLPRTEPFELHAHGYQFLNFVPMISTILFGVMAGQIISANRKVISTRNWLAIAGFVLTFGGLLASWSVCPLVKSIWTPSWALFSAGCAMSVLALLYHVCDLRGPHTWTFPFIVIGTNSILVYVLSYYNWRILQPWRFVLGSSIYYDSYWGALLASLTIALTVWLIAFAFYRFRVFIRI